MKNTNGAFQGMSLVVYVATGLFGSKSNDDEKIEATQLTLEDLENGQSAYTSKKRPELVLAEFTEQAAIDLAQWLKKDESRTCTIAWPHPVAWLAASLQQTARPKEALWEWTKQADLMLSLYKKTRRQVTLEGYAPDFHTASSLPVVDQLTLDNVEPFNCLMGSQLFSEDSQLNQAYNYLKASSEKVAVWRMSAVELVEKSQKLLSDKVARQEVEKLEASYLKEKEELNKAKRSLSSVENENGMLLTQLMKVQEAYEEECLKEKEEEELNKARRSLSSVEKENGMLLTQLMKVQEAYEEQYWDKEKSELLTDYELALEQLHMAQEQLLKVSETAGNYKKQAESRQKTINTVKQEHQQMRRWYERVTQWLRVNRHRNTTEAYRHSHPFKRALPKKIAQINESQFFDAVWYCEQYPDVKKSGMHPAEHYLKFGAAEGRNPSDKFDTCHYLCEYADVAASGQNPLLHYLRYGQYEARLPMKPRQMLPAPVSH